MRKGLVLGKFMPLHKGHLALIEFAVQHCDHLTVLLCYNSSEAISGPQRLQWLEESLHSYLSVTIDTYCYDETELSASSDYSEDAASGWAAVLQERYPDLTTFFSSEAYGDAVARQMGIEHVAFDEGRIIVPVSGTAIRVHPFLYWDYLPKAAQPFFVKKAVLLGSESTGKSTLAERLARQFDTVFVPEMAREVIGHTESCTYEDLYKIAELQALTIHKKLREANRILFCDTDLNITKSYSRYLFDKELEVAQWIEDASTFDLYLFLETDCPYVQDGTRLGEKERRELSDRHKQQLQKAGISFVSIQGDWEERFRLCCEVVKQRLLH
ncbi:MAG TPA: AAA family ATPase [Chitinophagaceae bacterium]